MRTSHDIRRWARALAVAAGAMDFATGLGMVFLPGLTLGLMRVLAPGAEALVYARFVGAFVGAVGASYLWAGLSRRAEELPVVLRVTMLFRLAAGTYCAVAVARGELVPMWLSVTATDYALVVAQAWMLRQGWGKRHDG